MPRMSFSHLPLSVRSVRLEPLVADHTPALSAAGHAHHPRAGERRRYLRQSRAAIERLFARFDGILHNHMPSATGGVRDTAIYSVIAREWPELRATLMARMQERHDHIRKTP